MSRRPATLSGLCTPSSGAVRAEEGFRGEHKTGQVGVHKTGQVGVHKTNVSCLSCNAHFSTLKSALFSPETYQKYSLC